MNLQKLLLHSVLPLNSFLSFVFFVVQDIVCCLWFLLFCIFPLLGKFFVLVWFFFVIKSFVTCIWLLCLF